MTEIIPHLNISTLPNGNLRLENEDINGNDGYIVDVHPMHVRLMAEQLGFIAAAAPADPEARTLAELGRDVDRLQRNLLRVRESARGLQREFATGADWAHADLSHEMNLINALVSLLDMAVDDFADGYTASDPDPPSRGVTRDTHGTPPGLNPATTQPVTPAAPKAFPKALGKGTAPSGTQKELELPA